MTSHIAARETINEARAAINQAAKIDPGRRALEGDLESAYHILEEVTSALDLGDLAEASRRTAEALELLPTDESRRIAEDVDALEAAIRLVDGIDWTR
jgi:hypothetical protein